MSTGPGSFIRGKDGAITPNLKDAAMKQRAKAIKTKATKGADNGNETEK